MAHFNVCCFFIKIYIKWLNVYILDLFWVEKKINKDTWLSDQSNALMNQIWK
jgi:hypothetical protein